MTVSAADIRQVGKARLAADLPRLAGWLSSASDAEARAQAATCLGWQRSPEALPPLASAAWQDRDPTVRAAALRALGGLKEPAAACVLEQSLTDPDALCRSLALRLAGLLGVQSDAIGAVLADPGAPIPVAAEACLAAGRVGDPAYAPSLWGRVDITSAPKVRRAAAIAWCHLAQPGDLARVRLADLLGDPDPEIRVASLGGLERLQIPDALALIRPLLDDPHPAVKRVAEAVFGRLSRACQAAISGAAFERG